MLITRIFVGIQKKLIHKSKENLYVNLYLNDSVYPWDTYVKFLDGLTESFTDVVKINDGDTLLQTLSRVTRWRHSRVY